MVMAKVFQMRLTNAQCEQLRQNALHSITEHVLRYAGLERGTMIERKILEIHAIVVGNLKEQQAKAGVKVRV